MKKRVTSLLVLFTMLLSTTTAMAYDWSQMRGEVDLEMKHKDARGLDGSGGATKGFTERVVGVKIMPFEESEFFVGTSFAVRDYEKEAGGRGGDEKTTYDFSMGNTYYGQLFGKSLTSRPIIGYKNNDREDANGEERNGRSNDTFYFRPQFTLSLNRQWSAFTRGHLDYKKRDDSAGTLVTKVEGGAKYRWNRTHTSSASLFFRDNGENASYYGYSTRFYQLRLKHHYKITSELEFIPYAFIGIDGEQKYQGSSYDGGDKYNHDKFGMKFKYQAGPSMKVHGGMAYETRTDYRPGRNGGAPTKYYKRNVISHLGLTYSF